MPTSLYFPKIIILLLAVLCSAGCGSGQNAAAATGLPPVSETIPVPDLANYAFPASIDSARKYLFFLHGKIIEDQGIPAISPEFGEYQYGPILERLRGYGFVVISEQRPKDTQGLDYAGKVADQVRVLLRAGVPPGAITVVGASKGAGIAIFVSNLLQNSQLNFVLLSICHPDTVAELEQNQVNLYGNVLSIYDSSDILAGSCQGLFSFSEGKGISRKAEVVLKIGTGHGILYKPLDAWIVPSVEWAGIPE
ncbi:MAG: alpha/beta hydrolase [Anaerolineaceae bacterium]|nr:alpha/beta hydrolase [Anaerolineaceae bacterium]